MSTDLLFCEEEYIACNEPIKKSPSTHKYQPTEIENHKEPVKAIKDLNLINDQRVLQNLLKYEVTSIPSQVDYLKETQPELTPSMRKIVTDWMLQVCQECQCATDVFMLAVNFMDRFLACVPSIPKQRLQLIGTVCLLISSKFKETLPVPGSKLIFYTDYSVTDQEIRDFELFVLEKLKWDVSTVTSLDFIDHILSKIGIQLTDLQVEQLKERIETILVLAVTNYTFSYLNPSLLAASTIHLVLSRFDYFQDQNIEKSSMKMGKIIQSSLQDIQRCATQLEEAIPNYLLRLPSISTIPSQMSKSHSDYGSSISSSAEDLPSEMNDSCILVN